MRLLWGLLLLTTAGLAAEEGHRRQVAEGSPGRRTNLVKEERRAFADEQEVHERMKRAVEKHSVAQNATSREYPTEEVSQRAQIRPSLECTCTSTRSAEDFGLSCTPDNTQLLNNKDEKVTIERSTVTCERNPPKIPEPGYKLIGRGYYKLHTDLLSWDDALKACARENANLAVVNSADEADILEGLFKENPSFHENAYINDQAWVGVSDLKTEGTFLTITGQTLKEAGWEKWGEGEPNNNLDREDCVILRRGLKTLNDDFCGYALPYFCEAPLS